MSLWGATTTDESKPKYLTDEEKRDCYANEKGWVKATRGTGGRAGRVHEEVLVAIGDLHGGQSTTAGLAHATISSTRFVSTALGAAAGGDFSAEVIFNEAVDVTGTPTMTVTNETDAARNVVLNYASGTGTNRLVFTATVAADATTAADVLAVQADSLTKAGGSTIIDKGTNPAVDSTLTHAAQAATTKITVGA